jgi:hypothetical protein
MCNITVTDERVELRDQLRDYQHRGEGLEPMSLYDFILNTYEDSWREEDAAVDNLTEKKLGRPRKTRHPYLSGAEKPNKSRVERTPGHELVVRFIGKWFPRNNNADGNNDLHHASILLFLRPWREIRDLKMSGETFGGNYTKLIETATETQKNMIENIQYYHDCWDIAQKRRDAMRQGKPFKLFDYEREGMTSAEDEDAMDTDEPHTSREGTASTEIVKVTEEKIEAARLEQRKACDRVFATQAMQLAHAANIFADGYQTTHRRSLEGGAFLRRATADDVKVFDSWQGILRDMTRKQLDEEGETNVRRLHLYSNMADTTPSMRIEDDAGKSSQKGKDAEKVLDPQSQVSTRPKMDGLNADQRMAHDIIEQRMFGGEY